MFDRHTGALDSPSTTLHRLMGVEQPYIGPQTYIDGSGEEQYVWLDDHAFDYVTAQRQLGGRSNNIHLTEPACSAWT